MKTLALYGMTSEVRGAPIGQAIALRPSSCPACHDEGSAGFECVRNIGYRCITRDIEFDRVAATLDELFTAQRVDGSIALWKVHTDCTERLTRETGDGPFGGAVGVARARARATADDCSCRRSSSRSRYWSRSVTAAASNSTTDRPICTSIRLRFLGTLLHAWNPGLYLGTHTGFWYPYETPYAWFYGVAQIVHVPQDVAQRSPFSWSTPDALRRCTTVCDGSRRGSTRAARIAGSVAFLFNMYVALNSQAQIIWLLVYATLPAMVGITARALRGELNVWNGAMWMALLVLIGGGINPPLVAINVVLIALYAMIAVALSHEPSRDVQTRDTVCRRDRHRVSAR